MKTLRLFILLSLINLSFSSYSQNTFEPLPCINKKFSIIAHIVRDYWGDANISEQTILTRIEGLNDIFDSICISFEICEFRYIDNFQYDIVSPEKFELMQIAYNEFGRINMYFAFNSSTNYGMATFGGIDSLNSGGLVALKTDVVGDIAHIMGHYFGLYDTYEGSQSANPELVDGSNCAVSGDSICDTPADPYYITGLVTWQDGPYSDFVYEVKDANGDYFSPLTGNIMASYISRCFFTYGQYRRMANYYLNSSQKMW